MRNLSSSGATVAAGCLRAIYSFIWSKNGPRKTPAILAAVIAVLMTLAFEPPVRASGGLRTVALSGMEVPGTAVRTTIGLPRTPGVSINNAGQVAFIATYVEREEGGHKGFAVARARADGSIELLAQEGKSVDGTGAVFGSFLWAPILNSRGDVSFLGSTLQEDLDNEINYGLFFSAQDEHPQVVALEGYTVMGTQDELAFSTFRYLLNDTGFTAFLARQTGSDPGQRIYGHDVDEGLTLLASSGQTPSNTSLGLELDISYNPSLALNDRNEVAFTSNLLVRKEPYSEYYGGGVFRAGHDGVELVAIEGAAIQAGSELQIVTPPDGVSINNRGDVAFWTQIGQPYQTSDDAIVVAARQGELRIVAKRGDATPGPEPNRVFGAISEAVIVDGQGRATFPASSLQADGSGPLAVGLYSERSPGDLEMIAQVGDPLPGDEELQITSEQSAYAFTSVTSNALGQVAFLVGIRGEEVNSRRATAILAQTPEGELKQIVRAGSILDVSDDPFSPDFREVRSVFFSSYGGNEDGYGSAFNDRGQLTFAARFTDGTFGVFVSDLVAVPEPASLILLAFGLVCVRLSRRRGQLG